MAFIKDNPPPATVILISGDRDFAYLLSTVRWRKYNVVLISNSSMTHESLTVQASVVCDWKSDILKGRPSYKPPLFRSQESDNLPESDFHLVGLPNERVAPAILPLTPPPRPASTATTNTVRSRRATPLPDVRPMELEATPMPPKTGTSVDVASAGIPMNHMSDDWIVAGLAGGSTMVHLSIVHGIVVDLVFQQGSATDSIDEDSFHSSAFVSMCAKIYLHSAANPGILEFTGNDSVKGSRRHPLLPRTPDPH